MLLKTLLEYMERCRSAGTEPTVDGLLAFAGAQKK